MSHKARQSQTGTSRKAQNPESKSGSESVASQDADVFTTPSRSLLCFSSKIFNGPFISVVKNYF